MAIRTLNCILVTGNELYLTIHSSHDYLMISDIPDVVTEYGRHYKINKYKEMFGTLGENEINVGTNLIDAIQLMVKKGYMDIWYFVSWSSDIWISICIINSWK